MLEVKYLVVLGREVMTMTTCSVIVIIRYHSVDTTSCGM